MPLTDKDAIPDIVSKFDTTGKVVEEILSQTKTAPQMQDWSEMDRTEMSFGEQLYWWLQSSRFEMLIICLLCANIFWMALELQISGSFTAFETHLVPSPSFPQETKPVLNEMLQIGDIIFSGLFLLEVSIRIVCLGKQFWKVWLNYADLAVSLVSAVEVISTLLVMPVSPVLVRILRLGKLARVIRLISMGSVLQSLQLLLKSLMSSIDMLFWSFCLLAFLQCVAGLVVSTLCREYLADDTVDAELRDQVFRYFGTFTRTFLTMFEVLFANWGPPCRVLVENISEWFALFFLFYRCVIGFAVLNVVGAVFIQQTLKTAHSDEELAYRQKEKEIQAYTRKVRKLFQSMDDSGDGALNLEEFSKLVTSPKLSFWMSQLELEYHDLLSLFEFLDDGDGQITLAEFIEGSARFRGGAKALDIWRLETKVEVLFEEMLNLMHTEDPEVSSYVQRAFTHSAYSHMKSALRRAEPKG
ncbi:Cacna1h [Symbiodinium necroappetens]|uniref:Cacna1h protein n=1 Tax=Symbiodinium necroappetens TaxID=1628268 RepID=A0A813BX62_9DINO|nr:Cacna1h [Symbiodinium necroappetens]